MKHLVLSLLALTTAFCSQKDAPHKNTAAPNKCVNAGPQSPRNIDLKTGENSVSFSKAPDLEKMNLCNVHFHRNAEHKSKNFSTFIKNGNHSGWACKAPVVKRGQSHDHEKALSYNNCNGVVEGDTIEVHWVYTSCDINSSKQQKGLGACMTALCKNPQLRVEAQIFLLSKDSENNFNPLNPVNTTAPAVSYSGSTTGTSYNNDHCSPLQVSWNVRTSCDPLNIENFSKWCSNNKYHEDHAHGVRDLVKDKKLLSPIK